MNAGSDHLSFRDAGVPVVMMSVEDNVIHTSQDALGRIQQQRLDDVARLAYATLAALAGS